ncbi:MAG: penicillin-binding transpeptidase domain-containing protein [Vicinamibacteria bacterium]
MNIKLRAPRGGVSRARRLFAFTTCLALAALGATGLSRAARTRAALLSARERLLAGSNAEAAALAGVALRDAKPWPDAARRARALQSLALLLNGRSSDTKAAAGAEVELEALAWVALRAADAPAALAVSDLLAANGDARAAGVRAAALVELGRLDEARVALGRGPAPDRQVGLAGRARHALDALREPGATLVRDRQGRLLGSYASGRLTPAGREPLPLPESLMAEALAATPAGEAGVRLSLDLELERLARSALGPLRGSIVLLDARRGDLLAAVTDERTARRDPLAPFDQRREPASIAKLITTVAAQRAGFDPNAEIARMTCNGHERFGSGVLWCAWPAGPLRGLTHALAVSCNLAFAELGRRLGPHAIVAELHRWGFDRAPLGRLEFGRVLRLEPDERQLADLSIGLTEVDVTPVHAALLAATIGNDGVEPVPRLVAATDGRLGLSPRPLAPEAGSRVIEQAWLPPLRRAMAAVVGLGGTAEGVAPAGLPVLMKTGTAALYRQGYHVNYIGIAPAGDLRIAFCLRLTHQPSSSAVNRSARAATARLLAGLAGQQAGAEPTRATLAVEAAP